MLSREFMGLFSLAVLWTATVLCAYVAARDGWRLFRRWIELKPGRTLFRVRARNRFAQHTALQIGRAQSASARQRAIMFRDRSHASLLFGGEVETEDGGRWSIEARTAGVQVWHRSLLAPPPVGDFSHAYEVACKPRGLSVPVTRSIEAGEWFWLAGQPTGETLGPLADGTVIVSSFNPLRFCLLRLALCGVIALLMLSWVSLATWLALVPPVFGTVSMIGAVLGLAAFLLVLPLGTWLRDRMLWPHLQSSATRWVEPSEGSKASLVASSLGAILFLFSTLAGAAPLDAKLVATSGEAVALSTFRGKPLVVFYEDAGSVKLNKPLKDELWNRKGQPLALAASVVGIAYLKSYNFFPVRPLALMHVKGIEEKTGIPILADLEGRLTAAPWLLPSEGSTVMLLDKDGEIVFRKTGALSPEEVKEVMARLELLSRA